VFTYSSRRLHTSLPRDWSSDVCSSDLFHSPGRPEAAADHAQFPAVVISAGPFGAADVVPSGDTGGGGGGAALVIVRVRLAETERSEERRVGKEWSDRWAADEEARTRRM